MCCAQITSLFLHWFPACVAWTERWHPDIHEAQASKKSAEAMREWDTATVAQLILFPCLPYLLWAVLYYIKVTPASLNMLPMQHGGTSGQCAVGCITCNIIAAGSASPCLLSPISPQLGKASFGTS